MEIGSAILIVLIAIGLWIHHNDVEQAKGAKQCYEKVTETQSQADAESAKRYASYEQQLREAKAQHDSDLTRLPAPIVTPVFVRIPGAVCAGPTGPSPQADNLHPNTSGNGPGSGERDIRPGLEAFKVRYGKVLLGCSQDLADWPP